MYPARYPKKVKTKTRTFPMGATLDNDTGVYAATMTVATTVLTPILLDPAAATLGTSCVGIPLATVAANLPNQFAVRNRRVNGVAAQTNAAWTVGDKLYWDNSGSAFTKTSTNNTPAGYAAAAKLQSTATGDIVLAPF
jgi:hypothetical protein